MTIKIGICRRRFFASPASEILSIYAPSEASNTAMGECFAQVY
jgi:hypothetical protein